MEIVHELWLICTIDVWWSCLRKVWSKLIHSHVEKNSKTCNNSNKAQCIVYSPKYTHTNQGVCLLIQWIESGCGDYKLLTVDPGQSCACLKLCILKK